MTEEDFLAYALANVDRTADKGNAILDHMLPIPDSQAEHVYPTPTASKEEALVPESDVASEQDILASAAEGRRLYIGNLAYATTEAELKQFFGGHNV